MSNLLSTEFKKLADDFLTSKLCRWRADIKDLLAAINRTAREFNKVRGDDGSRRPALFRQRVLVGVVQRHRTCQGGSYA
jgi:hypothetical protein